MSRKIIATGKVVFDKPNFYLLDETTRLLGLAAKRYVRLGLWAQDYLGKTLVISVEEAEGEETKTFYLRRLEDKSEVSGIGKVAWGVVFPDGVVVLRWITAGGSTAVYDSIESLEKIYGHNGKTEIVYD